MRHGLGYWWFMNGGVITEYARNRARMIAALGYTALAVDMYGEGKQADHPDEASRFASEVKADFAVAQSRFQVALEVLKDHAGVDPQRIGAVGYCFGGGIVLAMVRAGVGLKGVASFHGPLATDTPAQPGFINGGILVFNGAADPLVKPEDIAAFKKEMDAAGVEYLFVNYPGAKHAFTNPAADELGKKFNLPLGYNAEADVQSWKELQHFLGEIFM